LGKEPFRRLEQACTENGVYYDPGMGKGFGRLLPFPGSGDFFERKAHIPADMGVEQGITLQLLDSGQKQDFNIILEVVKMTGHD
jgi:hypothetical protein